MVWSETLYQNASCFILIDVGSCTKIKWVGVEVNAIGVAVIVADCYFLPLWRFFICGPAVDEGSFSLFI